MTESIKGRVGRYQRYSINLSRYTKHPGVSGSLTVVLSVALVAGFLIFAIQPTLVKIAELKTNIDESQKVLAQLTTKAKTLATIAGTWESVAPKLPYMQAAIPQGPEYRNYNKELLVLANQSGVTVTNITLGDALIYAQLLEPYRLSRSVEVITLPFTVRVGGNYLQLRTFVRNLMTLDRVIQIDNLTFAPEAVGNKSGKYPLTLNVTGKVFYLGEAKQLSTYVETSEKGKK